MSTALSVRKARWPQDIDAARMLLRNYAAHLARTPHGAAGICIQGFEDEVAALPEPYTALDHALLLAELQGIPSGCMALHRRVLADESLCELKRLWTEPYARGHGLGRALMAAGIAWARAAQCAAVVLDTHPVAMPEAGALYRSFGFREIERFNRNPVPDIVFFRLDLHGGAPVQ